MALIVEGLELRPDELAFHFVSDRGVEVDALANFLKRASTVAGRHGGELRVVGLPRGSLMVKLRAIPRSKVAQNAANKFIEDPVDQTLKVTGLVAAISGAFIWTFGSGDTPLAKAGAEIIDKHHVTEISVITNNNTTVVINQAIAGKMRQSRHQRPRVEEDVSVGMSSPDRQSKHQVTTMVEEARLGNLVGEVTLVQGVLHFRPDGYHYWVPVHSRRSSSSVQLASGARYRVGGHIETVRGQPDRIVVESADPILD